MGARTGQIRHWLYLSCVVPRTEGVGIEKRAWTHLLALAEQQPVDLVLMLTDEQAGRTQDLAHCRPWCRSITRVALKPTARGRRTSSSVSLLFNRLLRWGDPSWTFDSDAIEGLARQLSQRQVERVFCFRLVCFQHWQLLCSRFGFSAQRLVVDFDDVESVAQSRALQFTGHGLGRAHRLAAWLEIHEARRLERQALREAEVLVCSGHDRQLLDGRSDGRPSTVAVVPNSFPELPRLEPAAADGVLKVLFVGALSYPPNIDGAQFAVRHVLPALRRMRQGRLRLDIVGRRPGPAIHALAGTPDVRVVGEVDDVVDAYRHADVVLVPIRFGGGTRIKILEALTLGRPVVTTTIGCEGLELVDGRDVLIADDAESMARACLRVADDPLLAARLVESGRETFVRRYSEPVVKAALVAHLAAPRRAPAGGVADAAAA